MATNTVTVSGMFGDGKTYFADSPVVIDVRGLFWGEPITSPFTVVRVEVLYEDRVVGEFRADAGGQTSISFDISSALRAIWSEFNFDKEIQAADDAAESTSSNISFVATGNDDNYLNGIRKYRDYSLQIYTEYIANDDGGVFTTTGYGPFAGGRCLIGGLTEWERGYIENKEDADVSHLEHTGIRNGDASTKPTSSPERVGRDSITSWTDVQSTGTKTIFFPASFNNGSGTSDDIIGAVHGWEGHAPIVLRDTIPYTDFLFVNRRGALETCSARMLEGMDISTETQLYSRVEGPSFKPSRSLMGASKGIRRSWSMSSGYQTRDWAEWWTTEFLAAKQWWMRYKGAFVPIVIEPTNKQTTIYNRAKQQMASVEFTASLAIEG